MTQADPNPGSVTILPRSLEYSTNVKTIGLEVRTDRIAVTLRNGGDAEAAAVTTAGGPLDGLRMQRWLNSSTAVFEGDNAARFLLQESGGLIQQIVPVFINRSGGRDAVALNDVIVALRSPADAPTLFSDERFEGYRPLWGTTDQFVATLKGRGGVAIVAMANELAADPRVAWSEPDFYQDWRKQYDPNDPEYLNGNEWHLKNVGQAGGAVDADVDADQAWSINPGGSASHIIAIVDDGVESGHPDLNPWVNPGEIAGDSIDNDGNGFVDDINGWNFVNNNNNASFTGNGDRHGTAVAGVAAAKGDNGLGVAGPAYNARLLSARIFDNGPSATDSNVAAAIYYAAGRNKSGVGSFASVDVMNNSWGGGGYTSAIVSAFNYATTAGRGGLGTVAFAASGNDYASTMIFPAFLAGSTPGLISVGGSNNKDTRADYANWGPGLDLVAPTADLRSGYLWINTTDRVGAPGYNPGDYTGTGVGAFSGTSSSTPLAAGIGSLVLSQAEAKGISLTAKQVKDLLKNGTDLLGDASYNPSTYDVVTGNSIEYGRGRINAFTSVDGVGKPELSVLSMTSELQSGGSAAMGTARLGGSVTQTFRVRNSGTNDLILSNLTASGGAFNIDTNFGSSMLKLGEATTFTVRFSPMALGPASGNIGFTSNDADEGAFTFNINGTGAASNVSGRVFEDWNGNSTRDANDPGLAGRSLFLDANANGKLDRAIYPNPTMFPIPDGNLGGVVSTIIVTGQSAPISGLTVKVNISHPYIGDLALSLISPSGTRTLLFSGIGESSDNLINTLFDDNASLNIAQGAGPFLGSYKPQFVPMSLFDGETANGIWTLAVADFYGGDVGTLDNWALEFNSELSAIADSHGLFAIADVPNGSYSLRSDVPSGWTGTTSASLPVTIASPGDSFSNFEFGQAKNNRAYLRVRDDQNANGIFESNEPGVAGRTLFVDANGNGVIESPPTPVTISKTANLGIPDGSPFGALSNLNVSGLTGTIVDLDVKINVAHNGVGDLRVNLISPASTSITLVNHRGTNGVNFTETVFDDAAIIPAVNLLNYQAPFSANYKPETPLSVVNGQSPNGNWSLQVIDSDTLGAGTLSNWSLTFRTADGESVCVSSVSGNAFFDLPAGSNSVRLAPLAGWKFTNLADGKLALNASGAPLYESIFGVAEAMSPIVTSPLSVNNGSPQRSQVTSVRVDFSEHVFFSGSAVNAFSLTGPGGVVPLATVVDDSGPVTKVTLSFTPPNLADGKYNLTVNAGLITDKAQNLLMPPGPLTFHRLYGDFNGDATVDATDLAVFGNSFGSSTGDPAFLVAADANSDGTIDAIDFAELGNRFGISV